MTVVGKRLKLVVPCKSHDNSQSSVNRFMFNVSTQRIVTKGTLELKADYTTFTTNFSASRARNAVLNGQAPR